MEQTPLPEQNNPPQAQAPEGSIFTESDYSMEGYDKHIKRARNILFVVAGVQLISIFTVVNLEETARNISIGIIVFIAAIFTALGFWTKKKPYTALWIALILYGSLLVLDGVFDPTTIYKGIILKIAIVVSLITGLRNAKEAQDLRKAFGKE